MERTGIKKSVSKIDQPLAAYDNNMAQQINDIEVKAHFINNSQQQQIDHRSEVKPNVDLNDNEQTRERNLSTENHHNETLCSDQNLTDNNPSTLSTEQTNNESKNRQSLFSSPTKTQILSIGSSVSTDETINILLLGESGVGKSTFINAFVNYLTYETLSEAELKEPVVLMPVSFIMTTGDNFTEQLVELSVDDALSSEDFKHPGQSVTQHCRSYVFHLKHYDGKKLRIIDTPGFNDTRGLAQDDLNMQHILEYINNFTHLNAVCFLLKPNTTRIHIFFRECLIRLFDFLGPNIRQNIIFCFTNCRSTFYTPGDTAPLLKAVLQSISMVNISFQKENTFCFDSESFRYLVAIKNKISFNNLEKCDYAASWSKSATEFNHLLNYIWLNRTTYRIHEDWQSTKHAQLEIIQMIRPIVETIRNILRNIILCDKDASKKSIIMRPAAIHHPIIICLSCKHNFIQIAHFWFLPNCQHDIQNNSHSCSGAPDQHILLAYELDYNTANAPSTEQKTELLNQVSLLYDASAMFSNFLMHIDVNLKHDPFLAGLTRMLNEEKYICTQKQRNYPNKRLSEDLEKVIYQYTFRLNEVKKIKKNTVLSTIYNLIKIIRNIPDVSIQLAAVKSAQRNIMKQHEYEVPNDEKNASTSQPICF